MRFISKVITAMSSPALRCSERYNELGQGLTRNTPAQPLDEPEVPLPLRNPYGSSFVERVLLAYQAPPTGHPMNSMEKGFTPDLLQDIERARMMPESEKVSQIQRRDLRWFDGMRAQPKDVTRGEQSHRSYKVK